MCKSFSISLGLVTALAVALLCNVYLVFLLWSAGKNQYRYESSPVEFRSSDEIITTIKNSNVGLSLNYLKSMLNSTQRSRKNQSKSLKSLLNKLKRELKSRGPSDPKSILTTSSKVTNLYYDSFLKSLKVLILFCFLFSGHPRTLWCPILPQSLEM